MPPVSVDPVHLQRPQPRAGEEVLRVGRRQRGPRRQDEPQAVGLAHHLGQRLEVRGCADQDGRRGASDAVGDLLGKERRDALDGGARAEGQQDRKEQPVDVMRRHRRQDVVLGRGLQGTHENPDFFEQIAWGLRPASRHARGSPGVEKDAGFAGTADGQRSIGDGSGSAGHVARLKIGGQLRLPCRGTDPMRERPQAVGGEHGIGGQARPGTAPGPGRTAPPAPLPRHRPGPRMRRKCGAVPRPTTVAKADQRALAIWPTVIPSEQNVAARRAAAAGKSSSSERRSTFASDTAATRTLSRAGR